MLKERSSETVFVVSDDLLAQTLRTACVRSAHMLLVEFKFYMGYGLHFQMRLLFKKRKINLSVWK